MTTYHVDPQAVALGLEESEIFMAAKLVRLCLSQHGIRPWDGVETEIFRTSHEILLIARPTPPRTRRISGNAPRLKRC